jgi:pSer/pThr/pTyr-binding forkhead associated (FHA) protein
MSDRILGPPGPTAPRTTDEVRLEQKVLATGHAYVRYRDEATFCAVSLEPAASATYIGRDADCAIQITKDARVSRRHARLTFGASRWSISDGPSRNGTFVGGKRTTGEELLSDGMTFTVGRTLLSFHLPRRTSVVTTLAEDGELKRLRPSATQRKVLVELVRPFFEQGYADIAVPPSNATIAKRLGYETTTIRDTISDLYRQAGLARSAANNQRTELVRLAIYEGTVTRADVT